MKSIQIIGDIDCEMVAKVDNEIEEAFAKKLQKVEIELHSFGGDEQSAMAICSIILSAREHGLFVDIHARGTVQSAAVAILAVGSRRIVSADVEIMVHQTDDSSPTGTAKEAAKKADELIRNELRWAKFLERHTKATAAHWYRLHEETTYLRAKQAIKLGLADYIIKGPND